MDVMLFEPLFTQIISLFGLMYSSGVKLFEFFSTPLIDTLAKDTMFEDIVPVIDWFLPLANSTPFELMFGVGLIAVLCVGVAKYFMSWT